jgi:hypothetical protein
LPPSKLDLHAGVHDELDLLDAVLHRRPAGALEADAARGEAGEQGHRLHRVGALRHVPVHHLAQLLPVAHHLVDPDDKILLLGSLAQVDGAPPGEQLQEHHAERVHVALQRQLPCLKVKDQFAAFSYEPKLIWIDSNIVCLNVEDQGHPYQCVFRVEVAERAQHPGGRVQVQVLRHQLGEPKV